MMHHRGREVQKLHRPIEGEIAMLVVGVGVGILKRRIVVVIVVEGDRCRHESRLWPLFVKASDLSFFERKN